MSRLRFVAIVGIVVAGLAVSACSSPDPKVGIPENVDPAVRLGASVAVSEGCLTCHSTDGSRRSGPTLNSLAGSERHLTDGSTVLADDAYLRRAIEDPDAEIVDGYPAGVMTSVMRNNDALTAEEVAQLVAYIRALANG